MDDLLQEMIDPTPEPGDRPRRRRLIATIAIVGLAVLGVTSLTTGALFTDREQNEDQFATGTVDLTVGDLSFKVPDTGLIPGDVKGAPVAVTNAGSLALRYAIQYSTSITRAAANIDDGDSFAEDAGGSAATTGGDPFDVLNLGVYKVADAATCRAVSPSAPVPAGSDVVRAPARLTSGASGAKLVGDAATKAQPGDRDLSSSDVETLCFVLSMDQSAGNEYQDAHAQITLDFLAEQTANN